MCHKHVSPFIVDVLLFLYTGSLALSLSPSLPLSSSLRHHRSTRDRRDSTDSRHTYDVRTPTRECMVRETRANDEGVITFVRAIAETPRFGTTGISDIIINAIASTDVSNV